MFHPSFLRPPHVYSWFILLPTFFFPFLAFFHHILRWAFDCFRTFSFICSFLSTFYRFSLIPFFSSAYLIIHHYFLQISFLSSPSHCFFANRLLPFAFCHFFFGKIFRLFFESALKLFISLVFLHFPCTFWYFFLHLLHNNGLLEIITLFCVDFFVDEITDWVYPENCLNYLKLKCDDRGIWRQVGGVCREGALLTCPLFPINLQVKFSPQHTIRGRAVLHTEGNKRNLLAKN